MDNTAKKSRFDRFRSVSSRKLDKKSNNFQKFSFVIPLKETDPK